MTHQGPKAALGEGGSAHGRGSRRCCRGQHSKGCLLVPVSPGQLLPCQEGFALHLPECLPAERPEGELKWLRMGTRGTDRAGGLNQSTGSASAKHTQEAPSHRSSVSTLPSLFCTRCAARVTTGVHSQGMQPRFQQLLGSLAGHRGLLRCVLTAHLGHAALHSPLSCNPCSPSGRSISLDQK